jgi:hypothetical protein
MHMLLLALTAITTTQPAILDQTDEEWTAPGYRIIEETVIDPLDYGEPVSWSENCNGPTASIGCQAFFIPTEDGEKWRIVMLLKDKVVVLQEDAEAREIHLTCSPRGIVYSRNGRYAMVLGEVLDAAREYIYAVNAEYVNLDTGEVRTFEPMQNSGWAGMVFVNDDGSVYRWGYLRGNNLEYYDPDLDLAASSELSFQPYGMYSHAADGSLIAFQRGRNIYVLNRECRLLWEMESEGQPTGAPMITSDGSFLLLTSTFEGGGLECLDGFTGELLWSEMETGTHSGVPSVSGHAWAVRFGNRGLLFGTDADSRESINYVRYPAETWSYGVPAAVAENSISLSEAVSMPPFYQNYQLLKLIYINSSGSIVWVSEKFSVASSPLLIHSRNANSEPELGGGVNSIQSDGERFIYSDYEHVIVLRVEEGE